MQPSALIDSSVNTNDCLSCLLYPIKVMRECLKYVEVMSIFHHKNEIELRIVLSMCQRDDESMRNEDTHHENVPECRIEALSDEVDVAGAECLQRFIY